MTLEDLSLDLNFFAAGGVLLAGGGLHVVAADDDVVGIKILRDTDGGGAGGTEIGGKAEVVEGVLAVVLRDGLIAGGGETLVERVREGIADPGEGGIAGTVVEGEDEDDAAGLLGGGGSGLRGGEGDQEGESQGERR